MLYTLKGDHFVKIGVAYYHPTLLHFEADSHEYCNLW